MCFSLPSSVLGGNLPKTIFSSLSFYFHVSFYHYMLCLPFHFFDSLLTFFKIVYIPFFYHLSLPSWLSFCIFIMIYKIYNKRHTLSNLVRELSEEEKQMIILSEDFQRFMDRAGRVMERALAESVDIYTDYSGGDGEDGL